MDQTIRLEQQGRSIPRALAKVLVGGTLLGGAIVASFVLSNRALDAGAMVFVLALAVGLLPAIWLVDWGSGVVADGVTDLIARRRVGRAGLGVTMTLDQTGVCYTVVTDGPEVFVPWGEVTGSAFRRGARDAWYFCLDADLGFPHADATVQALKQSPFFAERPHWTSEQWARSKLGPGASPTDLRMVQNIFWFGTAFAMNLQLCHGLRVRRLNRALKAWTGGRCDCRPPDHPWWKPPRIGAFGGDPPGYRPT
jgi:hypothetical protein